MKSVSLIVLFFMALNAHAEIFVNCGQETNFGDYLVMVEQWQHQTTKAGILQPDILEARTFANQWLSSPQTSMFSGSSVTAIDGAKLIELKEDDANFRACAIFYGSVQAF